MGIGGLGGQATVIPHIEGSRSHTRSKTDGAPAPVPINLTGERVGMGGFTNAQFDMTKMASQQREAAPLHTGMLTGVVAGRTIAPDTTLVQNTQRSLCSPCNYMPTAGHYVPAGHATAYPSLQLNNREQLQQSELTNVAPGVQRPMEQTTDRQLLKQAKRGIHMATDYFRAPERTAAFCRGTGAPDAVPVGLVGIKHELQTPENYHGNPSAGSRSLNMAAVGCSARQAPKLPLENTRADFSLIGQQMANNQYAVPPLHNSGY
jgi:hypothetical protein